MSTHWQSDDERFSIHTGDSIAVMRGLSDESCDVIFADPPYNLSGEGTTCKAGARVAVKKGKWDKPMPPQEQYAWAITWIKECRRLLKPTGSIFVCGSMHSVYASGFALQTLGMRVLNDITWIKINPSPNLGCRTLVYAHESLIWASLGPRAKHFFNYEELKAIEGIQMKDTWRFGRPGKDELVHGKHSTQKPVALIQRCLMAALPNEGLVLDPFGGSHTTGVAAALGHKRDWSYIGIDLDPKFNEIGRKRIEDVITPKVEAPVAAE